MGTDTDQGQLGQLVSAIASLSSGRYSDFSILCRDKTIIPVHRAIICPRSQVLAAATDSGFKEATSKEIHLDDDEPAIVKKMIDFLYKLDYDDDRAATAIPDVGSSFQPSKMSSESEIRFEDDAIDQCQLIDEDQPKMGPLSLLINAKMYIIAEKYDIQTLKGLAVAKYKQVLPDTWNSSEFIESALLIYNNTAETDRTLRDVIVQNASLHVETLLNNAEFVDLYKIQGDLPLEILRKVVSNRNSTDEIIAEDSDWGSNRQSKKKKKKNFV